MATKDTLIAAAVASVIGAGAASALDSGPSPVENMSYTLCLQAQAAAGRDLAEAKEACARPTPALTREIQRSVYEATDPAKADEEADRLSRVARARALRDEEDAFNARAIEARRTGGPVPKMGRPPPRANESKREPDHMPSSAGAVTAGGLLP